MGVYSTFRDILIWKNPTTSASCLIALNLIYFLVVVLSKSILSLFCYAWVFVMAVGFLLQCIEPSKGGVGGDDVADSSSSSVEIISKSTLEENLMYSYDVVNDWGSTLRDLLLWKNRMLSINVIVISIVVGYIAGFFSMTVLTFLAIWVAFGGAFVVDKFNEFVWPLIEPYYSIARTIVCHILSSIPKMDDLKKCA